MDEEKFLQDRASVAQFLSLAESGTIQAGLSNEQKEAVNQYIVDQRNIYADASLRAQDPILKKTSPQYIENIQIMNQVKNNLANLANQQKKLAENQQQYLEDFQSGRISKANYDVDSPSGLVDVYTHKANMSIGAGGNLMFEVNGTPQLYSHIADYSLKSTDTANSILDIVDKVYGAKNKLTPGQMQMANNRLKSLIDEGGRNTLISLIKDDLLPGFENEQIDPILFKKENYAALQDYFLNTMGKAMDDINNGLPKIPEKMSDIEKYDHNRNTRLMLAQLGNNNSTTPSGEIKPFTPEYMGIPANSAAKILERLLALQPTDEPHKVPFKISLSTDPSADRYGGQYSYIFEKAKDGYLVTREDRDGNQKQIPMTEDQLIKEFSFGDQTPAAGKIIAENNQYAKYNKNKE